MNQQVIIILTKSLHQPVPNTVPIIKDICLYRSGAQKKETVCKNT